MLRGKAMGYAGTSPALDSRAGDVTYVWAVICAAARKQVDAASLAVFRIVFGLVGVLIVSRFFAYG